MCARVFLRRQIDSLGVIVHEHAGIVRFADQHTVETEDGLRLQAEKIIICTGGVSRRLSVPGCDFSEYPWRCLGIDFRPFVDAGHWCRSNGGADRLDFQMHSAREFNSFRLAHASCRVRMKMCQQWLRWRSASRASVCIENFGAVESFEKIPTGVRMIFSRNGNRASAEATLAVLAVGWVADIEGLRLASAGVETDQRGFVQVDGYLRTSTPNIFAAGDILDARCWSLRQYRRASWRLSCRARSDYDDWGPGESYRQLHRPGVCSGGCH